MTQPTALFLADVIEADPKSSLHHEQAAAELRRLHAEVERLREALDAMTAEFDSGDVNAGEWAAIRKARAALKETK